MDVWNTGSASSTANPLPFGQSNIHDPVLLTKQYQNLAYYNYLQYMQQMQVALSQSNNPLGIGLDEIYVPPIPQPITIEGLPPGRPNFTNHKPKASTYAEYRLLKNGGEASSFDVSNSASYQQSSRGSSDPRDRYNNSEASAKVDDGWNDSPPKQKPHSKNEPFKGGDHEVENKAKADSGWSDDETSALASTNSNGSSHESRGSSKYNNRDSYGSRNGSENRDGRSSFRGNSRETDSRNFGSRENSRDRFRSGDSSERPKRQPHPGDWDCPKCHVNNFKHRTDCFRCNEPKSEDAGGSTSAVSSYGDHSSYNRGSYRGRGGGYRGRGCTTVKSGWSDDEDDKSKKNSGSGGDGWNDEVGANKTITKSAPDADDWDADESVTSKATAMQYKASDNDDANEKPIAPPKRKADPDDWDVDEPPVKKPAIATTNAKGSDDEWYVDETKYVPVAQLAQTADVCATDDDEWGVDEKKAAPLAQAMETSKVNKNEDEWDTGENDVSPVAAIRDEKDFENHKNGDLPAPTIFHLKVNNDLELTIENKKSLIVAEEKPVVRTVDNDDEEWDAADNKLVQVKNMEKTLSSSNTSAGPVTRCPKIKNVKRSVPGPKPTKASPKIGKDNICDGLKDSPKQKKQIKDNLKSTSKSSSKAGAKSFDKTASKIQTVQKVGKKVSSPNIEAKKKKQFVNAKKEAIVSKSPLCKPKLPSKQNDDDWD